MEYLGGFLLFVCVVWSFAAIVWQVGDYRHKDKRKYDHKYGLAPEPLPPDRPRLVRKPKDAAPHHEWKTEDKVALYFAITTIVILACYLHLVGLAQTASFESYQAGYSQGFDAALMEMRLP